MIALGRSSRCDITLPDAQASRQHARLEWRRDGLYLVDTHSTNGTYVNGRRTSQTRLQGGEQVQISNTVFTIHLY
jgi:pSer/pThr/pTyr-binding forkhead associated (FHA) protein